jgi:hypothetical protein
VKEALFRLILQKGGRIWEKNQSQRAASQSEDVLQRFFTDLFTTKTFFLKSRLKIYTEQVIKTNKLVKTL